MNTQSVSMVEPVSTGIWRTRSFQLALLAVLVFFGTMIRIADLSGVDTRSPDERYYTWQANTLLDQGTVQGYTTLFQAFDRDLPPPTRIGYLSLLTTMMHLTGDRTMLAGAQLACLASVLTLVLVAFGAWRLLSPTAALTATLLYAVSPASLMFARRSWQESVIELLSAACLIGACLVLIRNRSWQWAAAWCLLGVACVSMKEVSAVVYLLVSAVLVVVLALRQRRAEALAYAAAPVLALLLTACWWAVLMGGFGTLARLRLLTGNAGMDSDYSRLYESGSPSILVHGLWIISSATVVLAAVGVGTALVRLARRDRSRCTLLSLALAVFVLFFLALAVLLPDKMNFRHISVIFAPLALLAGAGFTSSLESVSARLPLAEASPLAAVCVLTVVALAGHDLSNFHRHFGPQMQDMSIRMVLEAGGVETPAPVLMAPSNTPAVEPPFGATLTAAQWIDLSSQQARAGENEKSIESVRRALALDPDNAVAWNNLAAANENLQHWDEAIAAAQQAIKLQPDFQLAKNNLAWSIEQKNKQAGK
jgi:4-amino-4-deoxy-L-arabinose transferase-like glycosyltransferase